MRIILLLSFLLLFNTVSKAQLEAQIVHEDIRKLTRFLTDIVGKEYGTWKEDKVSHAFSIKVVLNKKHKVDTVLCSIRTPIEFKDQLKKLKQVPINWDSLVTMKKGMSAIIIIPNGDYRVDRKKNITINYQDILFENMYKFEDSTTLTDPSSFNNVHFLNRKFTFKFMEAYYQP
jgi:hypothetical protein